MTTYSQLTNAADLFDRAALMPRPGRLRPSGGHLMLTQRNASAAIHPQLPATPAWTYEGMLPGPVVEVRAGTNVEVIHRNRIVGQIPYTHVVTDDAAGGSMNDPGREFASTDPADVDEAAHIGELDAYTVVHLHGGPTAPDSDGWAENVIGSGENREDDYEFPRESWPLVDTHGTLTTFRSGAAPAFWYHDHAMSATRLNVYAGLAGLWLVRDPLEEMLGLPTSPEREIPLILQDRGLDTDDGTATGQLTGRLLHKVQTSVRECFAPVNLVNGLAWPRCEVSRRVYRLRVLNGSNARTYRLNLLASGPAGQDVPVAPAAVQQIGTDGGLLGAAIDLPAGGLVLAPGERADVLVDFGLIAQAGFTTVTVYNSAPAPWQGNDFDPSQITVPDPGGFRPIPQVMRFDLRNGPAKPGLDGHPIAGMCLDPEFRTVPAAHDLLPTDHGHTVVALREEEVIRRDDMGMPVLNPDGTVVSSAMLFVHELAEEAVADARDCNLHDLLVDGVDAGGNLVQVPAGIKVTIPGPSGGTYVSVGKRFDDTSLLEIVQGNWQLWKVLNLSPDTHPFHVHLTQFQAVSRKRYAVADPAGTPKSAHEFEFVSVADEPLDANERGWKDTVRVNPGDRGDDDEVKTAEMVTVAGCFARHAGRYVYHCHILEHEDTEMMRPYVVVPSDLMALMGGGHHH